MTIVMLSTPGYHPAQISVPVTKHYCTRWNYNFNYHADAINPDAHPSWNKISALSQVLENSGLGEVLVWIDADVLILDQSRPLEALIPEDVDFLFSKDCEGLNMGFFFVRNSLPTQRLLLRLWQRYTDAWPWEQNAMKFELLRSPFRRNTALLAESVIQNPKSEFSPTAFAMHYWAHGQSLEIAAQKMQTVVSTGWRRENFPHYQAGTRPWFFNS